MRCAHMETFMRSPRTQALLSFLKRSPLASWKLWVCIIVLLLGNHLRWTREPHWDNGSPNGRYVMEVYGNCLAGLIPCMPGQGGDRSGKIVVKDCKTGKVIGRGYVPSLMCAYEARWYEDHVYVMCGGEKDDIRIDYPRD